MNIGFFLALKHDVSHYLHAASLVEEARRAMPDVEVVQFSDTNTPAVPGVSRVMRQPDRGRSLLDLRLTHYASCVGEWLFVDTDVSIRADVRPIFTGGRWEVALTDRDWPHSPQGEALLHSMPFNTGVVFTREPAFWVDVLGAYMRMPEAERDWYSEQRAVYSIVRTGEYRVKILPGLVYNYPPEAEQGIPEGAALVHYKGPRKAWLSTHAAKVLSGATVKPAQPASDGMDSLLLEPIIV